MIYKNGWNRILDLTTATEITETTDYIHVVDTSDTTQDSTGTTKKATVRKLLGDRVLPDTIVGTTETQTLTNKTLSTGSVIDANVNVIEVLKKAYPIGSVYINASNATNPASLLGFGTWSAFGAGKVMVGLDAGDTSFDTAGKTGGEKTHIHRQGGPASDSSGAGGGAISGPWNDATFGRSSSGVTFGNYSQIVSSGIGSSKTVYPFLTESTSSLQPYIVVYFWKRTA